MPATCWPAGATALPLMPWLSGSRPRQAAQIIWADQSVSPDPALTAGQLAAIGLPGLPKSRWGIAKMAAREGWPAQPHTGRGGGVQYAVPKMLEVLPKRAAAALRRRAPPAAEPGRETKRSELKSWQLRAMQARLALLHEVRRQAEQGQGVQAAREMVARMAAAGELPSHLQRMVGLAIRRASTQVSARSLRRWQAQLAAGGEAAVAPRSRRRDSGAVAVMLADVLRRLERLEDHVAQIARRRQ